MLNDTFSVDFEDNKLLRAALFYGTELKWPVFPVHSTYNGECTCNNNKCQSPGKHPRLIKWQEKATTDQKIIREWWMRWPNSNIGAVTGRASGLFVLDVDISNNGFETLNLLTNYYGELPNTVESKTGGNGSHYFFTYQEGIRNKVDLFQGIDIRGDGGYIVLPPSKHISGRKYEWGITSKPYINRVAEPPSWLLKMLICTKKKKNYRKSSSYWLDLFNNTSIGNRNNNTASLVGYLLKRYVDPELVREIIHLWNSNNVEPPLSLKELDGVIESITSKEMKRRRGANNGTH